MAEIALTTQNSAPANPRNAIGGGIAPSSYSVALDTVSTTTANPRCLITALNIGNSGTNVPWSSGVIEKAERIFTSLIAHITFINFL
jgi:hypothetical protein